MQYISQQLARAKSDFEQHGDPIALLLQLHQIQQLVLTRLPQYGTPPTPAPTYTPTAVNAPPSASAIFVNTPRHKTTPLHPYMQVQQHADTVQQNNFSNNNIIAEKSIPNNNVISYDIAHNHLQHNEVITQTQNATPNTITPAPALNAVAQEDSTPTLNEHISAQHEPDLNEKLRGEVPVALSDALHKAPIRDLRASIHLNDSVLFTRELFHDDATFFERAIHDINECANMAQAQKYIHESLSIPLQWSFQNPACLHFLQFVSRRFS